MPKKYITHLNIFLFILMYAFRSFTDALYVSKGIESNFIINVKYIILIIAIIFSVFQLKYKKEKLIFKKEFFNIIFVVLSIVVISLVTFLISDKIYMSFFERIIKLVLPIIYVFLLINLLDFKDIYTCMCGVLLLSFVGYIIEIGIDKFNISNILSIDFLNSYSPFESHYSAGTSIAMCTFFMYYRKNKSLELLSLIFALFTFKRAAVLFAILLLILPKFINVNKELNRKYISMIKIIFVFLTLIYFWLLLPTSSDIFFDIFGETQSKFTMTRSDFLNTLLNMGFKSSGFGSITDILGRGLEMDLISIFLETTIVGLIIFINGYWNCSGNKVYTVIYMFFQFSNLLTSHSLTNSFNWILAFLIIGCISYKKNEEFKLKKIKFIIKRRLNGTKKSINNYTNI